LRDFFVLLTLPLDKELAVLAIVSQLAVRYILSEDLQKDWVLIRFIVQDPRL
jgi:hypothetical protein